MPREMLTAWESILNSLTITNPGVYWLAALVLIVITMFAIDWAVERYGESDMDYRLKDSWRDNQKKGKGGRRR